MAASQREFTIPDLIAACPLAPGFNPHYDEVKPEFRAWVRQYPVGTPEKRAAWEAIGSELLASHTYPNADKEQFRLCCETLYILWAIDEISDDQNAEDAHETVQTFYKALGDPEWDNGTFLCTMVKQLRARMVPNAPAGFMRRFLKHHKVWADAVHTEAEYRDKRYVMDLASYTDLRRGYSGTLLCLDLCEYTQNVDLPDYVFDNPVVNRLFYTASDLICWSNDIYSYDLEQSRGLEGANVLTIIMKEKGIDLQGAVDFAGDYTVKLLRQFDSDRKSLRSWSPEVDAAVARYVEGLGHWVSGNLIWSFDTPRYFGEARFDVKRTLRVKLREKRVAPTKTPSKEPVVAPATSMLSCAADVSSCSPSVAFERPPITAP